MSNIQAMVPNGRKRRLRRAAWPAAALLALVGCAGVNPQPVISAVPTPAGPDLSNPGCFGGQLPDVANINRAAAATLHIEVYKADGRYTGTAFVIRGSAGPNGHNRVVTAGHVADYILQQGGLNEAVSSNGVRIGYLDLVARPQPQRSLVGGRYPMKNNDIAVMEFRGFVDGGREAFDAIEGIDLSPIRPDSVMQGEFTQPSGINGGASGSAILVDGAAIGVLITSASSSADLDGDKLWQSKVQVMAGNPDVAGQRREVSLPSRSMTFAEPITHPEILAALGAAGKPATRPQTDFSTQVAAMPSGSCVLYQGKMRATGFFNRLFR